MAKRRFIPDGERGITDNDMLHALACRLRITEKDDGAIKVRLVANDLKCKCFLDTADSYVGVPTIKVQGEGEKKYGGKRIPFCGLTVTFLASVSGRNE